jgi:hypothetical protein
MSCPQRIQIVGAKPRQNRDAPENLICYPLDSLNAS